MQIDTLQLIQRLRDEEELRHTHEINLIGALEKKFAEWCDTQNANGVPSPQPRVDSSDESTLGKRPASSNPVGVASSVKRGRPPKAARTAHASTPSRGPSGHDFPRAKPARCALSENTAAIARAWIAERGENPFYVAEIASAVAARASLSESTVRTRLYSFLSYLEEKGQLAVNGNRRVRTYVATDSFSLNKRGGGNSGELSDKEKAYRELRASMPTPTTEE